MSYADSYDEPHFSGIPYMDRITLRHIKLDEGKRPCTAIEDIAALAQNPNGWMDRKDVEECKAFNGTEEEAVALRQRLELSCSRYLSQWRFYQ